MNFRPFTKASPAAGQRMSHGRARTRPWWLLAVRALALGLVLASGLCGLSQGLKAQEVIPGQLIPGELIPGEALQSRFDRRQPPPTQIGPLSIQPSLQLDESFNDNIFATPGDRRADSISTITAASKLDYAEGPNTAELTARVLDHVYAVHTTETEWEGGVGGIFRRQMDQNLELDAGGNVQRFILPRTDPTGFAGLTPTTYWVYDAFTGAVYGDKLSNLLSLRVGGSQTSFDHLVGVAGPINTTQRDFHEVYALGDFSHFLGYPQDRFFAELRPNVRSYDNEFDAAGFRRSSSGGQGAAGVTFDANSVIFVTASSGFQVQSYDDPRFGTVTEPNGNLNVAWWPTLLTSLNLRFVHDYEEAFFSASPGAVENVAVFELDHELQRNLIASLSGTLDNIDVVRSTANLRRQIGEAKLQYGFGAGFVAVVDYAYIHQSAGGGLTPFDENLFTVGVKKLF